MKSGLAGRETLSIIIPVYNEERTVASVVEIVRSWGRARQIIVVNDGSTDGTAKTLSQFDHSVKLITLSSNHGKSYALCEGVEHSTGTYIMFLDADLVGLTHRSLEILANPMLTGKADMVVGTIRAWGLGDQKIYRYISGERVLRRRDFLASARTIRTLGYGVEVFLNARFKGRRVIYRPLPYVYVMKRTDKYGQLRSIIPYMKETWEIARQVFRSLFSSRY